ncbi:MAG: tRNA (guanosine(37)-N1)-methyltransferase TrmD [Halobacteriovoraceae bacterium]|nr:tRNA (guanosine(37)-N1)-methyltransferase TrmD [Halobacteriovoraceae bacterium]
MKIHILSLFPQYFYPFLQYGISSKAFSKKEGGDYQINLIQIRDYADNKYGSVDDRPYGGGPGMVMRADILENTLLKGVVEKFGYGENFKEKLKIICPCPQGESWNDANARKFARESLEGNRDLVFICGRYEGIDQRFIDLYVDLQISLGDFILTGGELAVMSILDSSIRFVSNILGNKNSATDDSFSEGYLEGPLYTRPSAWRGAKVPDVLLSGHHKHITDYKKKESRIITEKLRPDLQTRKNN